MTSTVSRRLRREAEYLTLEPPRPKGRRFWGTVVAVSTGSETMGDGDV